MKSIMEEASSLAKAFAQAWERAGRPQECTVKILAEPEKNFIGLTTKSAKIAIFFNEPAPAQNKKGSTQSSSSRSSSSQQKHTPVQTQQQSRTQSERQQTQSSPSRTQNHRQEVRPVEQRSTEQRQRQQRSTEPRSNEPQKPRAVETHASVTREVPTQKSTQRENSPRENSSHENTQLEITARPEAAAPRVRPTWTEEMNQGVQAWIQESLQIMDRTDVAFTTAMSRSTLTVTFTKPVIEDLEKERLLFRSWSHLIVQHIKQEFKVHGKEFKIILKGSRN